jgi:phage N-6-adenine-methyltransferase
LFSSSSDNWATPQDFFDKLNEEFHFTLDVCATPENAKCERYFTPEMDGLKQEWTGVCWCNPPYSQIKQWIQKASESASNGATVVMLIPARTDTSYWHQYIWDTEHHRPRPGVEVRFIKGRLKFGGSKNSAPFPSAVVIFRPI